MIHIDKVEVYGWKAAIRGMRNPKNSWDKSDSRYVRCATDKCSECPAHSRDGIGCTWVQKDVPFLIGPNDLKLMKKLIKAGPEHRKFLRMIVVYCDITAPLYWWKEFDTYKVGTVANSCSTMHKIHAKEFTLEDFSTERLGYMSIPTFEQIIKDLNCWRDAYNHYDDMPEPFKMEYTQKEVWENMIQLLPTSYNQKRTVMLNYEVLANIYKPTSRQHHKLDEWNVDYPGSFCQWIESLPYSGLITGKEGETDG